MKSDIYFLNFVQIWEKLIVFSEYASFCNYKKNFDLKIKYFFCLVL